MNSARLSGILQQDHEDELRKQVSTAQLSDVITLDANLFSIKTGKKSTKLKSVNDSRQMERQPCPSQNRAFCLIC